MSRIANLLNEGEKILWQGKPSLAPFILPKNPIVAIFGLIWIAFGIFSIQPSLEMLSWGFPLGATLLPLLFGLIPLVIGLLIVFAPTIAALLAYRKTQYAITNRRLITQTGAIGLDTRLVDFDKIQEVYVNVGLADKLFGTGNIFALTAGQSNVTTGWGANQGWGGSFTRPSLASLKEPYEVHKLLQKAIQETKQPKS